MNIRKIVVGSLLAAATLISLSAQAYSGSQYEKDAKITLKQAQVLALKANPGTVVGQELEHKKLGSGLVYSFEIRAHHKTKEIGIDANTGAVLSSGKDDDD